MYARVIVDVAPDHLDHPFDYRVPEGVCVTVGQQVRVRFSGHRRDGWVVGVSDHAEADAARVQPLLQVHPAVLFDDTDLRLWRWTADRYAAPLASVIRHALPRRVAGVERDAQRWGAAQARIRADRPPCASERWRAYHASALLNQISRGEAGAWWLRPLPGDDPAMLVADLVARCVAAGRDALVLSPDPASEMADAVLAQAPGQAADLRDTADAAGRYRSVLRARGGHIRVVAGERGAVFTPLPALGLIVVEDEASPAYKERRSPRHHAREVALARARLAGAVCVLLSDLPSALLWRHLSDGHVQEVAVDRAEERRRAPVIQVVDRGDPNPTARRTRLSNPAVRALSAAVRGHGTAVVLAVRGGDGTALACKRCRRRRQCPNCAGSLKGGAQQWTCAACGWHGAAFDCADCGAGETAPLAAGAARLSQELSKAYPDADVVRMEGFDAQGPQGRPGIAVMTRGSVVRRPAWLRGQRADVVLLTDVDALLHRPAVDATEDTLRLWFAVARWTGQVVLQTDDPAHPAVQALVRWDPRGYWERESRQRAPLGFPPARSLVRVSAPPEHAADVVRGLQDALPPEDEILGPGPDGGALVKSAALRGSLDALVPLRHAWAKADRKVRVEVDPVDLD